MAFVIKDRVKEGTTTTGTGDITLSGASVRFATFSSFMVDGDTTYYAIIHTASGVDEWEVGLGTWNTGNTLSRTTVLGGTNGTSPVDFSVGTKDVFMTYPAAKALYFDASGNVSLGGDLDADGNVTIGGYIDLASIAHPAHQEGRVYYDNVHKALAYNTDVAGVELNLGQEEWIRVYNNTGATIDAGKPVYWSGNSNGVPTIGLGNGTEESKYNVQGLTTAAIANGDYGYVTISGVVRNIDTSGLTAGQNVFLGLSDGALQNASPTYPNFPMCIGWVISSDATEGAILVNQQNHSVNSFRVRTDAHVAGDMIIGGDLTVLGSQTIASSSNIAIANAWNYFNSGDTIGSLNTSFTGSGLNDASLTGHFTGPTTTTYYVEIDGVGTGTGGVDTFKVSRDNFVTTDSSGNDIDGTNQLIHSLDNIAIKFEATTGHTLGDQWTGTASPVNVDTGFATNRNTGTTGVGYTHMGIFFDVSAGKWVIFDEYDPEPEGTINTADASFSYGTLKGDTFEGNLLGNVTGNVSGNVTGSLTGNVTGNVSGSSGSTTGNAATATALQTSRTIQLTGDVTGSASFNGTANAVITAVVQDDSHAHIISNVDGLQAALDAKVDDTTTITAGTGLTGGGDLSVNRTLSLDTTYTDGRYVNATGDSMSGDLSFSDNNKATFGAGSDLQIYHDGSNSIIDDAGTGNLVNRAANFVVQGKTSGQWGLSVYDGAATTLYHNGATKLATTSTGVDVTGNISVTGTVDGRDVSVDGAKLDGIEAGATADQTAGEILTALTTVDGSGSGLDADLLDGNHASAFVQKSGDTVSGNLHFAQNPVGTTYGDGVSTTPTVYISQLVGDNDGWRLYGESPASNDVKMIFEVVDDNETGDTWVFRNKRTYGSYAATEDFKIAGDGTITARGDGYVNANQRVFADNYHPNADKLTTARNIALTGDVTGSANFDGSANISITATVADDSHNHSNYVAKNTSYEWTSGQLTFRSLDVLESASGDQATLEVYQDTAGADAFMQFHVNGDYAAYFGLKGDINDFAVGGWSMGGTYYRVWHAGNDGSGSGLDADLLDGQHASTFAPVNGSYDNDFYANQSFADNWFRPTGDTGLYFQSYGTGIRSVNSEGGQYGSVATYGGINGWEGYSIGGRVVFMHDSSSGWGIYNDVNNEWMVYGTLNGYVELRYDNATRISTTSAGVTVTGELGITGAQYIPRAWINFNGKGTVSIRADGNFSSVSDLGTGYYLGNLSTAQPNANFGCPSISATGIANPSDGHFSASSNSTSSVRGRCYTSGTAAYDQEQVTMTVIR